MNVLVVDDARDMLLILRRILTLLGHHVQLASDGQEAWELLQQQAFHVVISDWLMPVMDGPTLCRKIRAASFPHYVYIILLTGMSGKQSLIQGMDAGADDFATKPIVREELAVRLRAAQRVLALEHTLEEKNRHLAEVNRSLSVAQQRIQHDLKRAAILQAGVLPMQKVVGRLCLDWFYQPAEYIGGDTFNYFTLGDGLVMFYSIDVSGHGISSALLSMSIHTLLGSTGELYCMDELTRSNAPHFPALLAERLNYQLCHLLDVDNHYLTMILGVVDTVQQQLYFVQAGHPQPLLFNSTTGQVEQLACTGFPVGLLPQADYETITVPFPPNSRFIVYTDGLLELETEQGVQVSEAWLQTYLQASTHQPAAQVIAGLSQQLVLGDDDTHRPDDISLLIIDFCNWQKQG